MKPFLGSKAAIKGKVLISRNSPLTMAGYCTQPLNIDKDRALSMRGEKAQFFPACKCLLRSSQPWLQRSKHCTGLGRGGGGRESYAGQVGNTQRRGRMGTTTPSSGLGAAAPPMPRVKPASHPLGKKGWEGGREGDVPPRVVKRAGGAAA